MQFFMLQSRGQSQLVSYLQKTIYFKLLTVYYFKGCNIQCSILQSFMRIVTNFVIALPNLIFKRNMNKQCMHIK